MATYYEPRDPCTHCRRPARTVVIEHSQGGIVQKLREGQHLDAPMGGVDKKCTREPAS